MPENIRNKHPSKDQKNLLVNLMELDKELANERFSSNDGKGTLKTKWSEVANQLNALGGAFKDQDKWRRCWIDMKKYARASWTSLKEYENRTGLGTEGAIKKPTGLTDLDQRILNIISMEAVQGSSNSEGGFNQRTEAITESVEEEEEEAGSSFAGPSSAKKAKRIRGSAFTRDNILNKSNEIDEKKSFNLGRIANALEQGNEIKKRMCAAMEERNKIMKEYLRNRNRRYYFYFLRYEIGLNIRTGKIVWKNGGYPFGEFPDLKISREAYCHLVNKGELTLADKGYNDRKYFILPNATNSKFHKIIMSRHETVNKRIKQFKILQERFRNSLQKHPIVFHAVVNLTELMIENGEPLFSVF